MILWLLGTKKSHFNKTVLIGDRKKSWESLKRHKNISKKKKGQLLELAVTEVRTNNSVEFLEELWNHNSISSTQFDQLKLFMKLRIRVGHQNRVF